MFLQYYTYNVHINSVYSKEKKGEKKSLTLNNKKKNNEGKKKGEENEAGVPSILLG